LPSPGHLIDPTTDQSRPGAEHLYGFITEYRFRIAASTRDWDTALRLQHKAIVWEREQAAAALATPPAQLREDARLHIRSLAVTLQNLGNILLLKNDPDCLQHWQEAIELFRRINATREESGLQLNIGNAYKNLPQLRDLDLAEQAYQASLSLSPEHDMLGRGRILGQLAGLNLARYWEAVDAGADRDVVIKHLNNARMGYHHDLELLPDGHPDRAIAHNQLGIIYSESGNIDEALAQFQQSIRHHEQEGNTYKAGTARRNVTRLLHRVGRHRDALDWAHAALRDFQNSGAGATEEINKTDRLIHDIQHALHVDP
jgi:tetratricopeptide (TPR) repeat protein